MPDFKTAIGMVARFIMMPRRRLELSSLTVIEDGGDYISRTEYNVDWSKKYGYIFDQSGCGGGKTVAVDGIYFTWGDVEIREEPTSLVDQYDSPPWKSKETLAIRERNRTRRIKRLPREFRGYGRNLLRWLESNGIQEHSVWCSECGDCMPATGCDYCEHVWWCEKTGWYSTPSERCGCSSEQECMNDAA